MYFLGVPISVILRPLSQYEKTSLLVIPFRTENFELHGGGMVNFSAINYRKKIAAKIA
jgi:hypothetical protein